MQICRYADMRYADVQIFGYGGYAKPSVSLRMTPQQKEERSF
jgi:hypothetical protein